MARKLVDNRAHSDSDPRFPTPTMGGASFDPRIERNDVAADSHYSQVAALAHRYWQERGCPGDSPEIDWYRAERELSGVSV